VQAPASEDDDTLEDKPCASTSSPSVRQRKHRKGQKKSQNLKQITCKCCSLQFDSSQQLLEHQKVHSVEKQHSCHTCQKQFKYISSLNRHLAVHGKQLTENGGENGVSNGNGETSTTNDDKPFECWTCRERFTLNSQLVTHKRLHKEDKMKYTCSMCDRRFARLQSLHVHERIHSGSKPFTCFECGERFYDSRILKRHMLKHASGGPPRIYSCEECGKSFTLAANLKAHMKRHAGEFSHQCSYCGKCFIESHPYQVHIRQHTGERPFECGHCGKRFTAHHTMKRHELTHDSSRDNKPYKCSECGKQYSCSSSLRVIMKLLDFPGVKCIGVDNGRLWYRLCCYNKSVGVV
jgi:KRAB domain-containing zinc finger protein